MSAFDQSGIHEDRRPARGFRASLGNALGRIVERWQRGQAAAVLGRLNDRQLEDIGVSRNEIPRVVAGIVPSNVGAPSRGIALQAPGRRLHPTPRRDLAPCPSPAATVNAGPGHTTWTS